MTEDVPIPETPMVAAYLLIARAPNGLHGPVMDDVGRVIGTQLREVAQALKARLGERGITSVRIRAMQPAEIADLMLMGGIPAEEVPDRFILVEAQAVSVPDAISWARTLADRLPVASERGAT